MNKDVAAPTKEQIDKRKETIWLPVVKSIGSIVLILTFFSFGGAISQINNLDLTATKLTQGIFVWLSVIFILIVQKLTKHSLKDLGFQALTSSGLRSILFGIPCFMVIFASVIPGFELISPSYIIASLFMTIGVGFAEEIYFRGLIFQFWKRLGTPKAILVSSILFGICHCVRALGGESIPAVTLTIIFAFVYGIVFALMFTLSKSLWPCVFLHFLHDFIQYITPDGTPNQFVLVAAIQTILLIVYMIIMFIRYHNSKTNN